MGLKLVGILGAAVILAACDAIAPAPSGDLPAVGAIVPGTDTEKESVDGLIVGHRLMAAGEYELALKAYTRGGVEQGLTADVLSALGSANLKLGRLGQARKLLNQAVEKDPNFVPAWNNLGVVLMGLGEIGEARRVFRNAFALDNGNSEEIRQNLSLAIAKSKEPAYDGGNKNKFELVRRGSGRYLLLATPDLE